jgi:transcriptional regulator with XRE-family HTH domain
MLIMGFRENLKAELLYKDMLVKELAIRSGIKKRTLDNYLREEGSIPPADAAVRIANALDVSVEYLITGKDMGRKTKRDPLADLNPLVRMTIQVLENFSARDQKIVYNLVKSIKELNG